MEQVSCINTKRLAETGIRTRNYGTRKQVTTSDATRFAGETNTKLPRSTDWQNWTDPEIPEMFNPTEHLLDRHIGSPAEAKTAAQAAA